MPITRAQAEAASRGNPADMRAFFHGIVDQLENTNANIGTNLLQSSNGDQVSSQPAPSAPLLSVVAANGAYALTITAPSVKVPATIYYETSYSPSSTFGASVTTLPISSSTSLNLPAPGQVLYFRVRASFDRKTWSAYYRFPNAVEAGLQTSAATSPNIPLNQSNFAIIDSIVQGGVVYVRIYGSAGGPGTPWVTAGGRVLPSASLVGETPGSDAVVAFDPAANMYRVRYRIADVFPDDWIIVGQVSIVQTAAPSLPTIVPIIQSGAVVAYNVTSQGNGITAPLTLVVSGIGAGATTGTQTIQGGQLKSVAPGNAGAGYDNTTTVSASGGVYSGAAGGGGTQGGNGGRITNI